MGTIYGIDIGSNSVRLAKIENGKTVFKLVNTTQVSENLGRNGFLQDSAMERTFNAVAGFVEIAKKDGCTPFVFATEAFRSASNGKEFAERISRECGVEVDIISGELEAKLGYAGAGGLYKNGITVIDIGGASTEIVCGSGSGITYKKSVPIGVVAMKDACGQDRRKLSDFINAKTGLFGSIETCGKCIGIGGTSTSIAAIDLKLEEYDPEKVDGHCISLKKLIQISDMLLSMPVESIKKVYGVQEKRADVIGGGALLMSALLERLGFKKLYVSESDNLEGYAIYKGLIKSPRL